MLDDELQFCHLSQKLEVLGLSVSVAMLDRLERVTENLILQATVLCLAEVSGSLMKLLRDPKGAIGNVDIDSQTRAWLTNRRFWLQWSVNVFGESRMQTYIAHAHRRVYTLHGNDNIIERMSDITAVEEVALDLSVMLAWHFAHEMIKEG